MLCPATPTFHLHISNHCAPAILAIDRVNDALRMYSTWSTRSFWLTNQPEYRLAMNSNRESIDVLNVKLRRRL